MFGNQKTELPELRECKKCLRIVPLDEMYSYKEWVDDMLTRQVRIVGSICFLCAGQPVIDAMNEIQRKGWEMQKAENAKYTPKQVEVKDLPKGKVR